MNMNLKWILDDVWQLQLDFPCPLTPPISRVVILHYLLSFQNSNISSLILTFGWWSCLQLYCQNCRYQMRMSTNSHHHTYAPNSICVYIPCLLACYHRWIRDATAPSKASTSSCTLEPAPFIFSRVWLEKFSLLHTIVSLLSSVLHYCHHYSNMKLFSLS